MKNSILSAIFISVFSLLVIGCADHEPMVSPNGKLKADIVSLGNSCGINIMYTPDGISYTRAISVQNLGMAFNDTVPVEYGFKSMTEKGIHVADSYTMVSGKKSSCSNQANEYHILLSNGHDKQLTLIIRLYNNGVAFRYSSPDTGITPGTETTTFVIPQGESRWISEWDNNQAYESFYPQVGAGKKGHFQFPFLVQASDNCFALVTESGIDTCNAASSVYNHNGDSLYVVTPDINNGKYDGYTSPWRVVAVGSLADIVENTLVTDLAEQSRITDTGWIKPGVVSWIYWAYNHGSKDFQIVKQYIDMAVSLNLPYVLIDAEWDEMENGGGIAEAVQYAKQLGVKCLIWYNSSTAWVSNGAPGPFYRLNDPERREKEFSWLEKMGVSGVKIDFFEGDKQETMAYCISLLESAARHHLLVNFHGATIPRGWQRTYPNLLSTEAVRGAEWYNNGPGFTQPAASHNATLPFTRNVVGPMDYTPCTFSDSQYPHITTNAHELALTVVFESGLQHLADSPDSYLSQPKAVQDFLSMLPSVWDDTKLIDGYPGDYVMMARRRGSKWYVACINGSAIDRYVEIDLQKLNGNFHNYTVYADQDSNPHSWNISSSSQCPMSLKCIARGGFVIVAE